MPEDRFAPGAIGALLGGILAEGPAVQERTMRRRLSEAQTRGTLLAAGPHAISDKS